MKPYHFVIHFILAIVLLFVMPIYAWSAVHDSPDITRQQYLLNLLLQDCGSCHGMTLHGGLGPALLPENIQDKSNNSLQTAILEGRPGTPMPPWKSELTVTDAEWIVAQLRMGIKQ